MVSIIVGKKRAQFVRVEFYLPLARYRSGKPILAFSSKPTCFSWAAMCFGVISSVVKCVICTYGETASVFRHVLCVLQLGGRLGRPNGRQVKRKVWLRRRKDPSLRSG